MLFLFRKKGLTLLEVLLTIGIITVLISFSTSVFASFNKTSNIVYEKDFEVKFYRLIKALYSFSTKVSNVTVRRYRITFDYEGVTYTKRAGSYKRSNSLASFLIEKGYLDANDFLFFNQNYEKRYFSLVFVRRINENIFKLKIPVDLFPVNNPRRIKSYNVWSSRRNGIILYCRNNTLYQAWKNIK